MSGNNIYGPTRPMVLMDASKMDYFARANMVRAGAFDTWGALNGMQNMNANVNAARPDPRGYEREASGLTRASQVRMAGGAPSVEAWANRLGVSSGAPPVPPSSAYAPPIGGCTPGTTCTGTQRQLSAKECEAAWRAYDALPPGMYTTPGCPRPGTGRRLAGFGDDRPYGNADQNANLVPDAQQAEEVYMQQAAAQDEGVLAKGLAIVNGIIGNNTKTNQWGVVQPPNPMVTMLAVAGVGVAGVLLIKALTKKGRR